MDRLDEELLMLLATDLDRYFEQLMLAYQHRLHAFVLRLLYNQARRDLQEMSASCQQEAEDIVQDAFIRAYYALQTYSGHSCHLSDFLARLCQITWRSWLERLIQPIGLSHKLALHLTSSTQPCSEVMKRLVFLV
jgi:DNA-directed RNA polymerase specialized sigma24 family protein